MPPASPSRPVVLRPPPPPTGAATAPGPARTRALARPAAVAALERLAARLVDRGTGTSAALAAVLTGAARRGESPVPVLELVVVPHLVASSLFGDLVPDVDRVRAALHAAGITLADPTTAPALGTDADAWGERRTAAVTRRLTGVIPGRDGTLPIACTVHLTPLARMGLTLAATTGPAPYFAALMDRVRAAGYRYEARAGMLTGRAPAGHPEAGFGFVPVDVPTEDALFALAGVPFVPPALRHGAPGAAVPPAPPACP